MKNTLLIEVDYGDSNVESLEDLQDRFIKKIQSGIEIYDQLKEVFRLAHYPGKITSIRKENEGIRSIFIPGKFQLCPKCQGDGNLLRFCSPAVMGTNSNATCDVCKGEKLISMSSGKPPSEIKYEL